MLHQNQPQSRLILSRQVNDINANYDLKKQLDNSMYYSKVRVNTDSSPKLHGLSGQTFLSPKGEQKLDQKQYSCQVKATISPSSKLKAINYLEMIEKIKQQPSEEKNNLILVKFFQENEGQGQQTKIEKCQTLPASLTNQLVNNLMSCSSQHATESKAENERQLVSSNVLKEATNLNTKQGFVLNKDKSFEVDQYQVHEVKQSFNFLSKAKEEAVVFKEARLSPHKHSQTELNLKRFESPVTTSSYEEPDFQFSNKSIQTPSFNRCSKQIEKNYPKLYDELYASSFQYPEYEDPILEKENRSEVGEEQPFQTQRDNFISLGQNFSFRKDTLFASNNFIIQNSSKATYFGDYFSKKELQNENRIKAQLSYIPTSDELKSNISQSKILFVPLTSHTAQTPKTNLNQSILQESKSTLNSPLSNYPEYATYNSLMNPINYISVKYSQENSKSVDNQLSLDKIADPLSNPLSQVNSLKDFTQGSNSNINFSTSFIASTSSTTTTTTTTTPPPSSSQSSYANSALPLGLRDINIQQYLKSSNIPDYKPLTNQYSTLNYSKNSLVACQNYLTNYLSSQQTNENYPLRSYLNTITEIEQTKHKKSYLSEKRDNQQSSLFYTKL